MKTPAVLLALLLATAAGRADQADDLYRLGLAAKNEGKPEAAEAAFRKALQLRPNHAQARYELGNLPSQAEALKAKRREADLAKVKIPEITFRDVTLGEALTALGQMIEAASAEETGKDKVLAPNFIIQDPNGQLAEKSVSLQLRNIPARMALEYLLQQAGANARYDEHAIVIRPNR